MKLKRIFTSIFNMVIIIGSVTLLSCGLHISRPNKDNVAECNAYDFYHKLVLVTCYSDSVPAAYYVKENGERVEICDKPDKMPVIFESSEEMMDFVNQNLRYPIDDGVYRKTIVVFRALIDEQGKIDELRLLKGFDDCKECNEAAFNAAKQIKIKSPAFSNGKPVKSTDLILIPYGYIL